MKKKFFSFIFGTLAWCQKSKAFRIMKVTVFIWVLSVASLMAGPTYAQLTDLTLELKSATVENVLLKIENSSGFYFLYNNKLIDVTRVVDVNYKKEKITVILADLFPNDDVDFTIKDRQIILSAKNVDRLYGDGSTDMQDHTVKGKITDEAGMPVIGAGIVEKGTSNGTVSDINGNYSLTLSGSDAVLIISIVGYLKQEVSVTGNKTVDITMVEDITALDEIIVVGYGTQRKSDLTGSVASVSASDIKKYSTNDVSQLLQGRVAGVSVTSDGEAGATPSVKIRGLSTFGNAEPLYVIDGVTVTGQRDFNTNDIESITILKDASAGAIYGASAANGVVLITTRHGKKDTPLKIEYSGYYGWDKVTERLSVTGREDYQLLQNEQMRNGGRKPYPGNDPTSPLYIDNIDTDWQKEAYKTGMRQDHNLNLSGGGTYSTYNLSLDYFNSDGTFVGSGPNYNRYSARINSEAEKGIFKFGESLYFTHSFQDGLTSTSDWLSGGRPPMVVDLVTASPIVPVYDSTRLGGFGGAPNDGSQGVSTNVIGLNTLIQNTTEVDRTLANAWGEVKIIKSLKYKINFGYDRTFVRDIRFSPYYDMGYFINNTTASKLYDNDRIYTKTLLENTLSFDKAFGKHTLSLLAGQMFESNRYDYKSTYSEQLTEPYYIVLDNGSNKTAGGYFTEYGALSFLGRINYNFDDRYLITATTRFDASSRFAPANRWGTFPSMAVAWKLHNESFLNLPSFISELKLRASYGQLGNDKIDPYQYSTTVNENIPYNFNGTKIYGGAQTRLVSQSIQWETKTMTNIGFDASFLRSAIEWSLEYYNSKTTDLLVDITPPATTGANNAITTNAASLRNYGFETNITYHKRNGKLTYDINVNASTLDNKVLALYGTKEYLEGAASRTEVGRSIGEFYGYQVEGIFQDSAEVANHAFQAKKTAPGDFKFKDIDGDGTVDEADRTYLGRAIPKVYYGANIYARYRDFDFTFNASGSGGNKIHGRIYAATMHTTDYTNYHTDVLKRWTPENPNNDYPRMCQGDPNANGRMSDRKGWLQNGTYLRINTVSLGYSVPTNILKATRFITSIRVYATCQNLYTFKSYIGFNPDYTSAILSPGYDNGSYPKPRTFLLGIQAAF
jgi:TonB-linked SusC/RagA family outer membrane protein